MRAHTTLLIGVQGIDQEALSSATKIIRSRGEGAVPRRVNDSTFGFDNRGGFVIPRGYVDLMKVAMTSHEIAMSDWALMRYGNEISRLSDYLLDDGTPVKSRLSLGLDIATELPEELNPPVEVMIGHKAIVVNLSDYIDRR